MSDQRKGNSIESKYQEHIQQEKIRISRIMCVLGIVLFGFFGLIDFWALNSSLKESILLRLVVIGNLFTVYLLTFNPIFIKFYQSILSVTYIVSAGSIIWIIDLAAPGESAESMYFAGLMLVIMTLFSWSHLRNITSILITAIIISLYVFYKVMGGVSGSLAVSGIVATTAFIVSAGVIGFVNQLIRDKFLRENFHLQQSLTIALEDKTEEAKDHLYKANHDELTGLANRRHVTEQLENSLQIAKEKDKILLILFIDLNGFKQINDIYGHAAGDEVLTIVARRLELAVRGSDCLSRLGGDEFLVGLLIEKDHLSDVESMVKKYVKIISAPMNVDGQRLKVGASIGMAAYPIHGNKVSILMDIADKKMYQVKHGRVDKESDQNQENEPVVIFPGNIRQK